MRFLDLFFTIILLIQGIVDGIEKRYLQNKRLYQKVILSILGIGVIIMFLGFVKISFGVLFPTLITIMILDVIGWKKSIGRWLTVSVIYNFFFSALMVMLLQSIGYEKISSIWVLAFWGFGWIFFSLISYSKISLLINEIISGIATTVFTIATYIINFRIKSLPSSSSLYMHFSDMKMFEKALDKGDSLAYDYAKTYLYEFLEQAFILLLPIIGITALTIIFIKLKMYWLEENDLVEPEEMVV